MIALETVFSLAIQRFGFKLISAVTARGDMRFSAIEGTMNSARFIQFLNKLRKDAGRPIVVITDNARYHHSKETSRFLEAHSEDCFMASWKCRLNSLYVESAAKSRERSEGA